MPRFTLLNRQSLLIKNFLQSHPFFSALAPEEILDLLPLISLRHCRHREFIISANQKNPQLFFLRRGVLVVSHIPYPGAPLLPIDILAPHDCFFTADLPEQFLHAPKLFVQSYFTSSIFEFSDAAVEEILLRLPNAQLILKDHLDRQLEALLHFIVTKSCRNILRRTVLLLLFLCKKIGATHTRDSCRFTTPFSHRMMSQFLNITRETVTKAIQKLCQMELIHYTPDRLICVPSVKNLENYAYC